MECSAAIRNDNIDVYIITSNDAHTVLGEKSNH